MAQAKHEVSKIEIQVAVLEGVQNKLTNWQEENANALDPQRWRAVVDHLGDTPPIEMFCNDSGLERQVIHDWIRGNRLPSAEMCALYLKLLLQKVVEYQTMQRSRREQLVNLPEKEKKEGNNKLPKEDIIAFELPDGMDPNTPLAEIGNYLTLPARIRNGLKNSNIVNAGDVLKPDGDRTWLHYFLIYIPNFSRVSAAMLYHFLVEHGFKPVLGK